jgi:hypothetical protein
MKTNPCPRCGKTNPADIHTCTPKEVMEQAVKELQKPLAYYDPIHDKLLWAESPQYVNAQRSLGVSLLPLYPHPPEPARKPMTEEEIEDIYYGGLLFEDNYLSAFVEGFRQAEKNHGIGEE